MIQAHKTIGIFGLTCTINLHKLRIPFKFKYLFETKEKNLNIRSCIRCNYNILNLLKIFACLNFIIARDAENT